MEIFILYFEGIWQGAKHNFSGIIQSSSLYSNLFSVGRGRGTLFDRLFAIAIESISLAFH